MLLVTAISFPFYHFKIAHNYYLHAMFLFEANAVSEPETGLTRKSLFC